MKRGFYFIVTSARDHEGNHFYKPTLEEGSYEYHDKILVHRELDYQHNPTKWRVSHALSGGCITSDKSLKHARRIAKALQGFKIWEVQKYDDLCKAIKLHSLGYQDEVEQIKKIAFRS